VGPSDGRIQRSARTRRLAVEALLDLLVEGEQQPTAQQVSDRSGVSMRSIFRLFEDTDALHSAAIAAHVERVQHLIGAPPPAGPVAQRVGALVDQRAALFEAIAPVRRFAVRLAPASRPIRDDLVRANGYLRAQVATQFDAELRVLPPARRTQTLDALDVMTSFEVWDRMRAGQAMTTRAARRIVAAVVTNLLCSEGSPH
jgi:AcrR family transcriptional regulator